MTTAGSPIDFQGIAQAALQNAAQLLPQWFPAGKWKGREFTIGALDGRPGGSLSINSQTGVWSDFATDEKGGDLISLYAAAYRLTQSAAAKQISDMLGGSFQAMPRQSAKVLPLQTPTEWDCILPIPSDAPPPPDHHSRHGKPSHIATYRNEHGQPIGYVYRYDVGDGKKEITPLTWCRHIETGATAWRFQAMPKPRSLYGIELLAIQPTARILLVEGEVKCDAAQDILPSDVIAVSWLGGANAWRHVIWQQLAGRDVVIWPDNDEAGTAAAHNIAEQLERHSARVRVLTPPPTKPAGWDIADAIADGWTQERIMGFIDGPPAAAPLPLEYFDSILPSLDARDFVQGLLYEGSSIVCYGESNSGKTFFFTELALAIAAGLPWRGKRVEQGGVIYCVLEGGQGFRNRIAAWKAKHDTLEGPVHFAAVPASINLLDPEAHTAALIQTIQVAAAAMGVPVKLVVIDTLARAMAGGNENSSEDMGALVMNMDRIREATRAAVAFIHHSGKDQAKGARGHSSLRAAIDTEIEVTASEGSPTRAATVVKQREGEKGAVFQFSLEVIDLGDNRHGEKVTSCVVVSSDDEANAGASLPRRRLPQQQQRALEVLADLVAEVGQSGHRGTPAGVPSVPEKFWRDRFYDRALPGAEQKAKEKAFRRAADALVSASLVGMSAGRVWAVQRKPESGKQ